jgi:hypothetical protein
MRLQKIVNKGIEATAHLWLPLQRANELVSKAREILDPQLELSGAQVREAYFLALSQMHEQKGTIGPLEQAIVHFCHVTDNFAAGLFQCYDVPGLPRTNNDLEHVFGVARVHERRATGRRGAIPGVVVRGSVRLLTTIAATKQTFSAHDLQPRNLARWRELRDHLQHCEEARRQQFRFRKNPAAYLAQLETLLLE